MLIRGQTTEERIGQIAQGFGQGVANFQQGQDRQRSQSIQDEAIRRQQALQAMQLEGTLSEQTGRDLVGSGLGNQIISGQNVDLKSAISGLDQTQKAKAAEAALVRQGKMDERQASRDNIDGRLKTMQMNELSLPYEQTREYAKIKAANDLKPAKMEGQKVVDREFAKDYNSWTSGGAKTAKSEIEKLKLVTNKLRSEKVTTGGLTGVFPDLITSSKVLSVRSDVQSTIMGSLKEIMGASFTEKEGERVIKNTWNEADTTENNLARLDRLVKNLEGQYQDKGSKASYYQKNNTLNQYSPKQNSELMELEALRKKAGG